MNIYYISLIFQLLCGILPLLIVTNRKAIYKTELVNISREYQKDREKWAGLEKKK